MGENYGEEVDEDVIEQVDEEKADLLKSYSKMKQIINKNRMEFINTHLTYVPWARNQRELKKIIKTVFKDFNEFHALILSIFSGYLLSNILVKLYRNVLMIFSNCHLSSKKELKLIKRVLVNFKRWTYLNDDKDLIFESLKESIIEIQTLPDFPSGFFEEFLTHLVTLQNSFTTHEQKANTLAIKYCQVDEMTTLWNFCYVKLFHESFDIVRQQRELDYAIKMIEFCFEFQLTIIFLHISNIMDRMILIGNLCIVVCSILDKCDLINSVSKLCLTKIIVCYEKWYSQEFQCESIYESLKKLVDFLGEENNICGKLKEAFLFLFSQHTRTPFELKLLKVSGYNLAYKLKTIISSYFKIFVDKFKNQNMMTRIIKEEKLRIIELNSHWFELLIKFIELAQITGCRKGKLLFFTVREYLAVIHKCNLVDERIEFLIKRFSFTMSLYEMTNFKSEILNANLMTKVFDFSPDQEMFFKVKDKINEFLCDFHSYKNCPEISNNLYTFSGQRYFEDTAEVLINLYEDLFNKTYLKVNTDRQTSDSNKYFDLLDWFNSYLEMLKFCSIIDEKSNRALTIKLCNSCLTVLNLTNTGSNKTCILIEWLKSSWMLCHQSGGIDNDLTIAQVSRIIQESHIDSVERKIANLLLQLLETGDEITVRL